MPELGSDEQFICFTHWEYTLPAPFVIYADFQALNVKQDHGSTLTDHIPIGWAYTISCHYPMHEETIGWGCLKFSEPRVYMGPDAIPNFMDALFEDTLIMNDIVKNTSVPMNIRPEERQAFNTARHCHICGDPLQQVLIKKCRIMIILRVLSETQLATHAM